MNSELINDYDNDDCPNTKYNKLIIQGGPERTQHLRSLISKKSGTKNQISECINE